MTQRMILRNTPLGMTAEVFDLRKPRPRTAKSQRLAVGLTVEPHGEFWRIVDDQGRFGVVETEQEAERVLRAANERLT